MFSDVTIDADPFEGVDAAKLASPPHSLVERFKQASSRRTIEYERRGFARFPVEATALVRPIDTNFRPAGPAFQAVVVDLSASGLRLRHTSYVGSPLIAVQLSLLQNGVVTFAMSVLRSQPHGDHFEVAGRFIAKLERSAGASV